jgi:hypothetical protein
MSNEEHQKAMLERCEEQGHYWENCCSTMLHVYQQCKWCDAIKLEVENEC